MYLLADPSKCQAFGEKGYSLAMERYFWDNVGLRIKEIIEPIISK
jgi:glycosyltransferase involved in cell wall biosynthesis